MKKMIDLILNSTLQTSIIKVEVTNTEVGRMSINVWFTGCKLACEGCHNMSLKKKLKGMLLGEVAEKILERANGLKINWVVFTGGNPPDSPDILSYLLFFSKAIQLKTLVYCGYSFEEFKSKTRVHHMQYYLENCDLIKTGKYDQDKLSDDFFYASTNQKLYYLHPTEFTCVYEWNSNSKKGKVLSNITKSGLSIPKELFFIDTYK